MRKSRDQAFRDALRDITPDENGISRLEGQEVLALCQCTLVLAEHLSWIRDEIDELRKEIKAHGTERG